MLLGGVAAFRASGVEAVCRQGGVACVRNDQCCTGRCFKVAGVCSCTPAGKGRCTQPVNTCRLRVCNQNGQCVRQNRKAGVPCGDGKACNGLGACVSTCQDRVKDGDETDIDCGGSCAPCPDQSACVVGSDCQSGVCEETTCQASTCEDTVANGTETDVDCGGSCPACSDGLKCKVHADCQSKVCGNDGICLSSTCSDGVRNAEETDTDCGGPKCAPCQFEGALCADDLDCSEGRICSLKTNTCCTLRRHCEACTDWSGDDGCGGTYDCGDGVNEGFCPPPPSIELNPEPQRCCNDGDCPCGKDRKCCGDLTPADENNQADACFVKPDGEEFCCRAEAGHFVCGNVCCKGECDKETGECPRQSGRVGSYRRGPVR